MPDNAYTKKHRNEGMPLQVLVELGLNPFAIELLVESYTNRPEDQIEPIEFTFRGVRIRLEKADNSGSGSI